MRILKFRAWDKVKGKWTTIGFHIIGEVTVFEVLKGYKVEEFNNIEVTQFTGLLDKHGKEIYEGDILDGLWESYWMKRDACFAFRRFNTLCAQIGEGFSLEHKVIGNIYENPELIQKETKCQD